MLSLDAYNPYHWTCSEHDAWSYSDELAVHVSCRLTVFSAGGANEFGGQAVMDAQRVAGAHTCRWCAA